MNATASPTMTWAEVAELLHHPRPSSRAARMKVLRLEHRGLPRVPGVEPVVYLRDQVMAWLASEAAGSSAPAAPASRRRARPGRRRSKTAAAAESPIQARIRELQREGSR